MRAEHWLYTLPLRLRSLFRRSAVERELDDELRFHVDAETARHIANGMTPAAARTRALASIGGVERRKEEVRATRRVSFVENLLRDIRYALRTLGRTPAFTIVAIVTLALGIGANTAIFTVVNSVLLRPLPYGDPSRLVVLQYNSMETVAPAYVMQWQQSHLKSFEAVGAANYHSPTLTGGDRPEQLQALRLTPEILPMMQVRPLLGRWFLPEEAHDGTNGVAILTHGFWQRRYGGDSSIVGKQMILDGRQLTVVGVMPAGFRFAPFWATTTEIFTPNSFDGAENNRGGASYRVFARLRPGVTREQAQAEMSALGARTKAEFPDANASILVTPLQEKVVGSVEHALWVLLAAVALVLLIACANVMHLQLMRAASRERETAVRVALGASAPRLVQQSLIESLIVSLTGGALGLAFALAALHWLVPLGSTIPRVESIHVDGVVFGFMLLIAMVAGILSGVIPAIVATRVDAQDALKQGGRAGHGRSRRRASATLVMSEFAMAVVLLVGAGLVLRSFAAMVRVDPGFDSHQLLTMKLSVRGTQHFDPSLRSGFYQEVMDEVKALAGVRSVGMINHIPLNGDTWNFPYYVDGHPLPKPGEAPTARFGVVNGTYFTTTRIPIKRGRAITVEDNNNGARVVVIDDEMARAAFPNEDPIGKRITVDDPSKHADWFTIVGVAGSIEQGNWGESQESQMYFPYWMKPGPEPLNSFATFLYPSYMSLVVRANGDPDNLRRGIERVVHRLDPDAPIAGVLTMDAAIANQVIGAKFYLILLGGFAGVALLLAAIGIYGVISYSVANRTREIGIRIALGADRSAPFRLVVGQGLRLALGGAAIGVIGALILTRYIRSLLYGVQPNDLATFVVVPLLLVGVAIVACYVPARRARSVDPIVALRGD